MEEILENDTAEKVGGGESEVGLDGDDMSFQKNCCVILANIVAIASTLHSLKLTICL